MSVMPEQDLDPTLDAIVLLGTIKSVLIRESSDSDLKLSLPKSELADLRALLQYTELPLQVIIRPGKAHP